MSREKSYTERILILNMAQVRRGKRSVSTASWVAYQWGKYVAYRCALATYRIEKTVSSMCNSIQKIGDTFERMAK